jgi:hypothetical protein
MHKYYVSITEVELNENTQSLEISIKFIGHDLESALEEAGIEELYLGTEKEKENADKYLYQYLSKSFEIRLDDKKLNYHFVGKEINNDDFIYCYLESDKVESFDKIHFYNSLLTEKFSGQSNILYFKIGDKKLNYTFTKEKRKTFYSIK